MPKEDRMLSERELEALNYIKANKHFFSAPFLNQISFGDWMEKQENLDTANKLTKNLKLMLLDANENPNVGDFFEALLGKL